MSDEQRAVMLETLRRMRAIESFDPGDKFRHSWVIRDHENEVDYGPRYACGSWFDYDGSDRIRMRYLRAIQRLERAGVLTLWREHGRKMSHIRLTSAGRVLAEKLEQESVVHAN